MAKHALLIANSRYIDERLNSLSAPSEDVVALKSVLDDPSIGGFDSAEPITNSSLEQVQRDLKHFLKNRSPDDIILIYFTGHGLLDSDGKLWLALAGSDAESADVGSLEAGYLRKAMDKCASRRQVLILDCCHSGAIEKEISDGIVRSKDGITRPAILKTTFDSQSQSRHILASSSATQRSYEIGAKSVFTKALVEGLREGSAAREKAQVSLRDLANHVRESLRDQGVAMNIFISPDSHEFDEFIIASNPRPRYPIPDQLLIALNDTSSYLTRIGAIEGLKELGLGKNGKVHHQQVIELFVAKLEVEEHVRVHEALKKALDILRIETISTPVTNPEIPLFISLSADIAHQIQKWTFVLTRQIFLIILLSFFGLLLISIMNSRKLGPIGIGTGKIDSRLEADGSINSFEFEPFGTGTGKVNSKLKTDVPFPKPTSSQKGDLIDSASDTSNGDKLYLVNLASFKSEMEASTEFARLKLKHASILGNLSSVIIPAKVGKITRYRLAIGPLTSREQATQICVSLIAAGERDCLVR